jgi:catechol 2,3-dioxygenase-like lactoylglutathione lyase family enzyme
VFDHVTIRVSERDASERFYDTLLQALGFTATYTDHRFAEWDDF